MALLAGECQRREAVCVACVDGRPDAQQRLYGLGVPAFSCQAQHCTSVAVAGIWQHPLLQKLCYALRIALLGCLNQAAVSPRGWCGSAAAAPAEAEAKATPLCPLACTCNGWNRLETRYQLQT